MTLRTTVLYPFPFVAVVSMNSDATSPTGSPSTYQTTAIASVKIGTPISRPQINLSRAHPTTMIAIETSPDGTRPQKAIVEAQLSAMLRTVIRNVWPHFVQRQVFWTVGRS